MVFASPSVYNPSNDDRNNSYSSHQYQKHPHSGLTEKRCYFYPSHIDIQELPPKSGFSQIVKMPDSAENIEQPAEQTKTGARKKMLFLHFHHLISLFLNVRGLNRFLWLK